MKHIFYLLCGIAGLYKVITSFIYPEKETTLFSFEINVWVYRVIWSIVIIAMIEYFYRELKKQKINARIK